MTSYQPDLFRIRVAPCGRSSETFCELQLSVAYGMHFYPRCGSVAPTITARSS
jgi:hypothetical protein